MTRSTAIFLLTCLLLFVQSVKAQPTVEVSGLAFADYAYLLASPVEGEQGQNSFGYRRLYLTTDFTLSDAFSGRARLEAKDSEIHPFVKDLYVKWSNPWGKGHELVFGLSGPPVFGISERVWGYRSLEKTLLDRNGIASSRDMGVAARGPVTSGGTLRYGLMVANNSGVNAETDKYKRVYAQMAWYPAEPFTITLGGDYAGYGDERTAGTTANAFIGYQASTFRVGLEGFFNQIQLAEADALDNLTGVSLFATLTLGTAWEAVARVDQVQRDLSDVETNELFVLAGVAYQPHANVRFIPNVLVSKENADDEAWVSGRITLDVHF